MEQIAHNQNKKSLKTILFKIINFPVLQIILGVALVNVLTFISESLIQLALSTLDVKNNLITSPLIFVIRMLSVYFIYLFFVKIFEKRKAYEISIDRQTIKDFSIGCIIGLSLISLTFSLLYLLGYCSIEGINNSADLFQSFRFAFFFAFLQDIVYFAIIFRISERHLGSVPAIIIAGIIFGFKHLLFPDYSVWSAIAMTIEIAVIFSALYIKTRRIWMMFGFHFMYNFIQNGFLLKIQDMESLLRVKVNGPEIIAGSQNGLESSIIAIILSVCIGAYFMKKAKVEGKFILPFWKKTTN